MNKVLRAHSELKRLSCLTYLKTTSFLDTHIETLMVLSGIFILSIGTLDFANAQVAMPAVDTTVIQCSNGLLLQLVEGSFGSLIFIVSGLGMLVAAATGAYRAAWTCLVVIVGAFTLRSWVAMFFGGGDAGNVVMNANSTDCRNALGL